MKQYNLVLTREAKNDMIDIGDYIAYTLLEPETAHRFISGLRSAISTLKKFPNRFSYVNDQILSKQKIRCMPYKNYYIFYKIEETTKTVIVLRIGYH